MRCGPGPCGLVESSVRKQRAEVATDVRNRCQTNCPGSPPRGTWSSDTQPVAFIGRPDQIHLTGCTGQTAIPGIQSVSTACNSLRPHSARSPHFQVRVSKPETRRDRFREGERIVLPGNGAKSNCRKSAFCRSIPAKSPRERFTVQTASVFSQSHSLPEMCERCETAGCRARCRSGQN